jgi:DNA-directed RNA polymerase specialized sigma24 family protein
VEVTAEEFSHLLALLGPDPEQAAEQYESIRLRLIRFFERKGCNTPEELADETFDRVARKAAQPGFRLEKPDPYSLIAGFARLVALEHFRNRKKEEPIDGDFPQPAPPAPDPRLFCLRRCLQDLRAEDRQLLLDFHTGENRIRSRQQLAERLGCSPNALRIRVHRVRGEFKKCLATCLAGPGE